MSDEAKIVFPGDCEHCDILSIILPKPIIKKVSFLTIGPEYFPKLHDVIIGVVSQKTTDAYLLDINYSSPALLPFNAFSRATKQHYPKLKQGDVVMCGVSFCVNKLQLQVSCCTSGESVGWDTGETYLGPLENGVLKYIGLINCKMLLSENCTILFLLTKRFEFTLSIGMNGYIYVTAPTLFKIKEIVYLIETGLKFESLKQLTAFMDDYFS